MSIEFRQREREGICLLEIIGKLRFGEEELRLQQRLASLLSEGRSKILLNLRRTESMDPEALGILKVCSAECRRQGGKLGLISPPLRQTEPSLAFALETNFEVFDNEYEGVNSFFPERAPHRLDVVKLVHDLGTPALR